MPFDSPARWQLERSFHHSRYDESILTERDCSISVCLPARNCAATIGSIVEQLVALRERGGIDEVVVIDGDSEDATIAQAAGAGAAVHRESDLMMGYGPVAGKGDAMWRALSVLDGDLICFMDADMAEFSMRYPLGLLGPLLEFEQIEFVKAFYRRPFRQDGIELVDGGGRVNHLVARPALAIFYPALAGVRQPLAGEIAARRSLLECLPFATGYGVEVAMLLDVVDAVGLDGMAQVDLDVHSNRHQPLLQLSAMGYEILRVLASRLEREGRLSELDAAGMLVNGTELDVRVGERPPMVSAR
jgi:glucosyl-3-phosphoglycerate synthase